MVVGNMRGLVVGGGNIIGGIVRDIVSNIANLVES